MYYNKFAIAVSLINLVSSLSIVLDNDAQVCYNIVGQQEEALTISYVVSGQSEDQVKMELSDDKDNLIFFIKNKKEGSYTEHLPYSGTYRVCFVSPASTIISFDFQISTAVKKTYAESDQLKNMTEAFKSLSQDFKTIYRNQHFQSEREAVHQQNFLDTEFKLKTFTVLKLCTAICLTMIQLYFMKRFSDKFYVDSRV